MLCFIVCCLSTGVGKEMRGNSGYVIVKAGGIAFGEEFGLKS